MEAAMAAAAMGEATAVGTVVAMVAVAMVEGGWRRWWR